MSGYPRLDETGLNTLAQALADATKLQGVIKVCETEAEWNQKTQEEKDDPNIYWFLPWRTSTSGEINDNTTAPDKVWSSSKISSENETTRDMITDIDWNATDQMTAGKWIRHNGLVYKVKVTCTGVEPPNATYYDPQTIGSALEALNSDITASKAYAVISVSPISGIGIDAGSKICLFKIGNTVQGTLTITGTSANISTTTKLFEIPVGYRPAAVKVSDTGSIYNPTGTSNIYAYAGGTISLYNNGEVYQSVSTSNFNGKFQAQFYYTTI